MSKRQIVIGEKDAWRLYELLEVLHDFLHQEQNYRDAKNIDRWLEDGVYEELRYAYYDVAAKWFPVDEETDCVNPPPGSKRRFPYS